MIAGVDDSRCSNNHLSATWMAELGVKLLGHNSVGRTKFLDWPESATWQRAALFDTRLSSSDSTPSQFDRKFVIRKKVAAPAVAAFFCVSSQQPSLLALQGPDFCHALELLFDPVLDGVTRRELQEHGYNQDGCADHADRLPFKEVSKQVVECGSF